MDQFKASSLNDLHINIKNLSDYGCLESVLVPPTDRFSELTPPINDAINLIQAEMMSYVTLRIMTCPNNFSHQNEPMHIIKLLVEDDNEDYPGVLFSDGYEKWELEGNTTYQYNLFRAQIQGYNWFFSKKDEENFNIIKETSNTKLFMHVYNGMRFIPFPY